jgi:large subunit ribosomal protein L29
MAKAAELREMSDEQLGVMLKETTDNLFRLRLQSQTERLDAPSELRKHRRLVARILTIQRQRRGRREAAPTDQGQAAGSGPVPSSAVESSNA